MLRGGLAAILRRQRSHLERLPARLTWCVRLARRTPRRRPSTRLDSRAAPSSLSRTTSKRCALSGGHARAFSPAERLEVCRFRSQVLQELVGDKSLERFRQEYDKLHRALKKSHESEKRLIKKCRELNQVRARQRQRVGGGSASPNAVPLS